MLVPSTFTGRYKNRITNTAIKTESIRSRNHATVARSADDGLRAVSGTWPEAGAIASGAGSVMMDSLFPEYSEQKWLLSIGISRQIVRAPRYFSLTLDEQVKFSVASETPNCVYHGVAQVFTYNSRRRPLAFPNLQCINNLGATSEPTD